MALMVKDMDHARKLFRFGEDPDVKLIDCDVKQPHEITRKFQDAMQFFEGSLDHVIICHGKVVTKGVTNCTIPNFDQTMLINVRSVMHITSMSIPYLKKSQGSPSITILTSN